jgi:hypothetical protein
MINVAMGEINDDRAGALPEAFFKDTPQIGRLRSKRAGVDHNDLFRRANKAGIRR